MSEIRIRNLEQQIEDQQEIIDGLRDVMLSTADVVSDIAELGGGNLGGGEPLKILASKLREAATDAEKRVSHLKLV